MSMSRDQLQTYLNDHLSGATAGLDLARHLAEENSGEKVGATLGRIASEINEERELLKDVLHTLELDENPVKKAMGWVGEKATLPKFHQREKNTDVARLLGLEALSVGVYGKRSLWQVLETLQPAEPRLERFDFHGLRALAENQLVRLEECRMRAAA